MQRYARSLLLAVLLSGAAASITLGQTPAPAVEPVSIVTASSITWADLSVPGFAPGTKIAVINGNPNEAGAYTIRLSFPDGYRFPPHWHPMAENVTVLSGALLVAMGDRADESKVTAYGPGDFLHIEATHPHFGGARGATVVQLHGQGPFAINLAGSPPKP
jgi:quercetin dioxygenase-like cupin family protein